MVSSSAARSSTSWSKVVSLDRLLAAARACTGDVSWKKAHCFSQRPMRSPKRATSSSVSAACRSPTVFRPSSARRSWVRGPTPCSSRAGSPAKRSQACSRESTTKPAGFSASLAVLATRRDGPTPTEMVIPVRSRTSATSSRRARSGLSIAVTSA